VIGDLHLLGSEILIEGGDKQYLSYALNFKTFGNMSQKLWLNKLFFSVNGQFGQILKNYFFQKQKIEIGFLECYIYTWKALNHSILINETKVMKSFSL